MIARSSIKLLLLAGLVGVAWQENARAQDEDQGPPPALVEVANATTSLIAPSLETPGTVVSLNDSRISAEISGRITWVAPEGTYLKEGDVLARIEDRDMLIEVNRLKANITRLKARVTFLTSEMKRAKKLVGQGNATESRAQQSISDLVSAEQDVVEAQLQLEQAELNAARTLVRAPFPGRVVERLAQVGEYATPGGQLARLVDTDNLEIRAQAPVRLTKFVEDGATVTVTLDGEPVESKVRATVPVGDAISRTMEIRVSLPEGHGQAVGAAVSVGLPADKAAEVTAVPRDALILRADGTYVFRVAQDGTAERLRVRTGASQNMVVAIIGDISAGDQVIIRGGERLRPGQAIRLVETLAGR